MEQRFRELFTAKVVAANVDLVAILALVVLWRLA
jgi:hypothetical protein